MSRSTRKHPCCKICGNSNKKSKNFANRRFRRIEKRLIYRSQYDRLPELLREVSNVYNFASDGLAYWMFPPREEEETRYWTIDAWKKCMRK